FNGPYVPDDVRTGALWPYLDGKLTVLICPLAQQSDANPAYFQFLSTYVMNSCLSNLTYDGQTVTPSVISHRLLHKVNEFPPTSLAFWDFPQTASIGEAG